VLTHLEDAFADWPDIAQISQRGFAQSSGQTASCLAILDTVKPIGECFGALDRVNGPTVIVRLRMSSVPMGVGLAKQHAKFRPRGNMRDCKTPDREVTRVSGGEREYMVSDPIYPEHLS
jgi:hypothetical protein